MCATLILDLAHECGIVCHHHYDLVGDKGQEMLKCEVDCQQFQVVDMEGSL